MDQPFVIAIRDTVAGQIPLVSTVLMNTDRRGTLKARWAIGRMHYTVDPGLYGVGTPDDTSEILVTANYKMSFDALRSVLDGRKAWLLVLDTKGINVWCAAGKGTFGTNELVAQIAATKLAEMVSHRRLILPQLGAPGIAAHKIRKTTGFTVTYGPVMAVDLPTFLDNGYRATQEMRRKRFPLHERLALIPVELVGTLKWSLASAVVLTILAGFFGTIGFSTDAVRHGGFASLVLFAGILSGAVLTPALLPWLPGRAFAAKGLSCALGFVFMATPVLLSGPLPFWTENSWWTFALGVSGISSFLAMNFTGASTYTSLSGVRKEMRFAVPLQIITLSVAVILWAVNLRSS